MKIERVDEKTVKCYITNDELEEYDISYKDFVTRSEKAKEIVEEIIEQAEEEVGYQPPRFAFDLQIMLVPEEGMVLTFSEKEPGEENNRGRELFESLKEMQGLLEEKKRKMAAQLPELLGRKQKDAAIPDGEAPAGTAGGKRDAKPEPPKAAVFGFDSLKDVCAYASVLPKGLRVKSSLYMLDETCYLFLEKGTASYERYNRACIQALEFGWLFTAGEQRMLSLEEHGRCVVADHALRKLAGCF